MFFFISSSRNQLKAEKFFQVPMIKTPTYLFTYTEKQALTLQGFFKVCSTLILQLLICMYFLSNKLLCGQKVKSNCCWMNLQQAMLRWSVMVFELKIWHIFSIYQQWIKSLNLGNNLFSTRCFHHLHQKATMIRSKRTIGGL